MDFQETFLTLFWPVWTWMLALAVAGSIGVGIYWLVIRSGRFKTPSQTTLRFAGVEDSDEN
jgi:hypothetical protein